ncbi:ubiquitin carboxyl-terminal hydrolase YUH1 [Verticillium alfalfae VaMs.102]|uniref:Ubiquitin carboxyl-terminal hydrolase n=1 Tax=Verticillium alfalfae (strain VaMs.102 / ATCC MYA-4576 / FGSC 10136) TaxID=526221 RepID=C9SA51_VERA1|nr:ubiquitin carboxyl-terminal hydrolase YUH1 [Verticillium alfalfae VaMs.102]EEY16264.1 ubiquitin carboxyl-terminal hydrolase YUH1 [Verticillium alfalfae VaMs.102]
MPCLEIGDPTPSPHTRGGHCLVLAIGPRTFQEHRSDERRSSSRDLASFQNISSARCLQWKRKDGSCLVGKQTPLFPPATNCEMTENNPDVMNQLAATLGLSSDLEFYDVYSLDDPELLAHIPRPALALLVIIPLTPAWDQSRQAEDADKEDYTGSGPDEPVIWFKQTIGHACGSIGLLHSLINGPAMDFIKPGSDLADIRAVPYRSTWLDVPICCIIATRSSVLTSRSSRPATAGLILTGEVEGGHFVSFFQDGWEALGARRIEKGPSGQRQSR